MQVSEEILEQTKLAEKKTVTSTLQSKQVAKTPEPHYRK